MVDITLNSITVLHPHHCRISKIKYKGILNINNNTIDSYKNWSISILISNSSKIKKCNNCSISKKGNMYLLTPLDNNILNSNTKISYELEFKGNIIDVFNFNGTIIFKKYLYNLPLTNLTNIKELTQFNYQYSYNKHNTFSQLYPNPLYFALNEKNGLEINIYKDDQSLQKGNSSYPRTELKGIENILDNISYTLSFDQLIVNYPGIDYQYSWLQIYGNSGPNIILRFRNKKFQLLSIMGNNEILDLPGSPLDDIGLWINWKLEFLLSSLNGYIKVYKNNVLLGVLIGNTSGGNNSYLKHGIYSQQMNPIGNMKIYTKNLELYNFIY